MARWNSLPAALLCAVLSGGAFALYGHPWFGLMYGSIFLFVWCADTWYKHKEAMTPCAGGTRLTETPPSRIITHPLRPTFFGPPPGPSQFDRLRHNKLYEKAVEWQNLHLMRKLLFPLFSA
jgi:hypothetical protein